MAIQDSSDLDPPHCYIHCNGVWSQWYLYTATYTVHGSDHHNTNGWDPPHSYIHCKGEWSMIEQFMECRVLEISNKIQVFYHAGVILFRDHITYSTRQVSLNITIHWLHCITLYITTHYIVHNYTLITSVH